MSIFVGVQFNNFFRLGHWHDVPPTLRYAKSEAPVLIRFARCLENVTFHGFASAIANRICAPGRSTTAERLRAASGGHGAPHKRRAYRVRWRLLHLRPCR